MNKYKVEIRTDSVWIVEAHSERGAEEIALEPWRLTGCRGGPQSSTVTKVTNLSDPVTLVADMYWRLKGHAFVAGICKYCGGVPGEHAEDCVLGLAYHFLDQSK